MWSAKSRETPSWLDKERSERHNEEGISKEVGRANEEVCRPALKLKNPTVAC